MKDYTILIVDDEPDNIELIIDILEKASMNFNFLHATNGRDAIEVAKSYKLNIILLDWQMPGINGIETLHQLKKDAATKQIPVVMTTGRMTQSTHLEEAFKAGAIDFIRKPIDPLELRARVNSMLNYADRLFDLVKAKDQELSSWIMNMFDYKGFTGSLLEQLKEIIDIESNKLTKEKISTIIDALERKEKEKDFDHFESYFQKIHPGFFGKISKDFADLTPGELKLAALLRLNLSSKEIAAITYTSIGTVKTARFRLRKKMNLSSDENIVNFLMQY